MQDTFYHTLPNGIRLVYRHTASPVSYTGVMVGAGTRDELPKENGMAHYIEHCLFKGTTSRSARQIIRRIEDVGGEINAYTTKEETTYYAATLSRYVERTLELLADMLFNPLFPLREIQKEMQVVYDEIESYNDSPSELIYDDFENLIFSGHPLAQPVLGTRKTLRHFTPDMARRFMSETYLPSRMVIFVQSNLPYKRIKAWTDTYFSATPYNIIADTRVRKTPDTCTPQSADFHRHTHQTHVMLGARAYPLGHERQLALYLLNNILGGGAMNSRLNLSLREKKGLVYTVESQYTPISDTGYWSIYFASDPENREQCLDLVHRELLLLQQQPISTSAFARALTQLRGQMAIAAENQENAALTMAKQVLYSGEATTWQQTFEKIAAFSPAILQDVANEIFNENNISFLQYI